MTAKPKIVDTEMPVTEIRTETVERTLVIRLDGPQIRNALNKENFDAIRAAVVNAQSDPKLRAVVITGDENFFCAGGNLGGIKKSAEGMLSDSYSGTDTLSAMSMAIRDCPMPVIAAIEGGAAGAGVSLALACDMIVASKESSFTVAYVKVGLTPDGGATHFLTQALPRQLAAEMCMTGAPVSSERLAAAGVINRLTEPGDAYATAMKLAGHFANAPRRAVSVIKNEIEQAHTNSLAEHMILEAHGINHARFGNEAREGISAFLEKRKPEFNRDE